MTAEAAALAADAPLLTSAGADTAREGGPSHGAVRQTGPQRVGRAARRSIAAAYWDEASCHLPWWMGERSEDVASLWKEVRVRDNAHKAPRRLEN